MSVLKTCPYCGGRGYVNRFEDIEDGCRAFTKECIACEGTGSILCPETNADRIRRMSDEELAYQFGAQCPKDRKRECDKRCSQCWLEWLQQPAEEDT